ncbi:MAG: hypothetical protein ACOYI9_11045, partial [Candidatus Hydrogenedentales bacterium]
YCLVLAVLGIGTIGLAQSPLPESTDIRQSESDYYVRLVNAGLTGKKLREAYVAWYYGQEPFIEIEALAELIEAKRESLKDGYCNFIVEVQDPNSHRQHTVKWAFNGPMILRDEETVHYSPMQYTRKILKAYDGNFERRYPRDDTSGSIWPFSGYNYFYSISDPMARAMLTDANRDFQGGPLWYDLVHSLRSGMFRIQEATELIDNAECLVLYSGTPAVIKIYLDIEKVFSVVRLVKYYALAPPSELETWPHERQVEWRVDLHQLVDYDNGVWLPSVVYVKGYDKDGEQTRYVVTRLLDAGFNIGLSSETFSDVFPPGIVVTDMIDHIQYRDFGNPEDVEHFLDSNLFTLPEADSEE